MFQNLKIRTKLLIVFLVISIVPFAVIGIIAVMTANDALSGLAFGQLESLREVKKTQLEMFFQERQQNMGALIETVTIFKQAAFDQMRSVQEIKKAQVEDYVQKWRDDITLLSTTTSLQSMGNFEMLLDGKGGVRLSTLDMYEKQYLGDLLKEYIQKYHYADALLITEKGNIVYTVQRGPDLGQNVLEGPLQTTTLAACFQQGMQGLALLDFAPYPTSDDAYAAFIAAPVMSELLKKPIGVVVLKMNNQVLNTIVQRREGMGTTGETYLVGQQADIMNLRSDQVVRSGKIGEEIAGEEVSNVLAGHSGEAVKIGRAGNMEITRYDPLDLPDLTWGIVTSIQLEEVISPKLEESQEDYFARFIKQYGYTDLALIHPDGTVFYTVAHAEDYGSNLFSGPYQDTELARGVHTALTSKTLAFSDVLPYPAAQGKPVAFMAQPVLDGNAVELVVAVQIPIDVINTVMKQRAGLGKTAKTYLVGSDFRMRSESYLDPERHSVLASFSAPGTGSMDTFASRAALAGTTGKRKITNYLDQPVLSAYAPLHVGETTWAFIAEMNTAEAFAAVHRLSGVMRWVAIFVLVGTVAISLVVTGYITRPLQWVARVARNISEGDLSESLDTVSVGRDEIGMLVDAFQKDIAYFREMATAATNMAVGDLRGHVAPRSERDVFGQAFQNMTGYLKNLAVAATAIAEGHLDQEIQPESEHDVLGNAFHTMAVQLRENFEKIQQEVAERTRAQAALEQLNTELEQRVKDRTAEITRQKYILDTFMATVPDSIYFKDCEGRITHANKAHAVSFGLLDPAEEIGKTDFDFFSEELARPKYEQEQEIIRTGEPVLAQEEPDVQGRWSLTTKMPLRDENGEIIGTFGISRDITPLKQAQLELATAYEEIKILNSQLHEENLRMGAELDVARRLQEMMLPPAEELQQITGLDVVGYMQPADEVGGDYYDVLSDNGILHVGIGDVTGHGLESGVLMLMTQTVIRTLIEHGETDPLAFVNTLNRTIYKNVQRMGADKTLTFALINYQQGQLKIVGQHEELLVVRKGGKVERVDTIDLGIPLGLEAEIAQWVHETTISLQPEDGIVLYTDGITEAENSDHELYGLERLCEVIGRHWDKPAEAIKQAVIKNVTRYIGQQKVYDDMTLVVLKQE